MPVGALVPLRFALPLLLTVLLGLPLFWSAAGAVMVGADAASWRGLLGNTASWR